MSIGYDGSQGRHLCMGVTHYAPPDNGVRAFTKLAANSPLDPGVTLNANVTQASSNGMSNYTGLWANFRKNALERASN